MYGLVFEGGGARGAYHIGVYKAILEEGLEISGITGTSIGALNGAMIVQGDYKRCYDLWHDISYSMIFDANDDEIQRLLKLQFEKGDLKLIANNLRTVFADRGVDITPLRNLLDTYIDEEKIRSSDLDFGMVTVNITDFKSIEIFKENIPNGEMKDYLLASAYLPVFKAEKFKGKRYLDGAFYDNLPFRMLESKGYKDFIIVRTHARGRIRKINDKEINAIIISPTEDIGGAFTIGPDMARKNLELGYYDGLRAFRNLKGYRYYIKSDKPMDYYFNILLELNEEQVNRMREFVKTPQMDFRRALFEYIIPKLGSILGLQKNFNYEDFIIGLLEKKAEAAEIERFKIYEFEEILALVECEKVTKIKSEEETQSALDKLIEKVDIATFFNKDEVLLQITDIIFC